MMSMGSLTWKLTVMSLNGTTDPDPARPVLLSECQGALRDADLDKDHTNLEYIARECITLSFPASRELLQAFTAISLA